jgi:DNA-binding transcriptional MocR family regulator
VVTGPSHSAERPPPSVGGRPGRQTRRARAVRSLATTPGVGAFAPLGDPDVIDLAHASPAAPAAAVLDALDRAAGELPRFMRGHGYDVLGLADLRAVVAERFTARGLPTRAEEVLVTGGGLHGIRLCLELLVAPGDRVLVDQPTYPNALDAARRVGGRLVAAPLASEGWDVEGMTATVRQTAPRAAYLAPEFHNPTGLLMPADARRELARALATARTTAVVDETLLDLALDGTSVPPPFAAGTGAELALTVGSLAKSFWGGLRIGWVRGDVTTIRRLAAVRASLDLSTPVLEQLVARELLLDPEPVLAARRQELTAKRDLLIGALRRQFPDWDVPSPAGGLVLWCRLDAPVSTALAAAALRHGVAVAAGPRFAVDGTLERWLRVPYTLPDEVLLDAVQRLGAAHLAVTGRGAGVEEMPVPLALS